MIQQRKIAPPMRRLRPVNPAIAFALLALVCRTSLCQSASSASAPNLSQAQKEPVADRQKKLSTDADRLVILAQQLQVSVDKSNKNVLSMDVIREAERIEKLAHELREGTRP